MTDLQPVELDAPLTLHIAGGVVARRNAFFRRTERKAARLHKLEDEALQSLKEVTENMVAARESLHDFHDEEYLREGKDPEVTPAAERKPADIIEERRLFREIQKRAQELADATRETNESVEKSQEYAAFTKSAEEFGDWLEGVFAFYGTFDERVDWKQGTYVKYVEAETVPEGLQLLGPAPEEAQDNNNYTGE